MNALSRFATVDASTKRAPALAGGKRGSPATNLTSLDCTPLYTVAPELANRMGLGTPHALRECYVDGGLDIVVGDLLVVAGIEYPIKAVAEWADWRGETFLHLTVEDLKR